MSEHFFVQLVYSSPSSKPCPYSIAGIHRNQLSLNRWIRSLPIWCTFQEFFSCRSYTLICVVAEGTQIFDRFRGPDIEQDGCRKFTVTGIVALRPSDRIAHPSIRGWAYEALDLRRLGFQAVGIAGSRNRRGSRLLGSTKLRLYLRSASVCRMASVCLGLCKDRR